MQKSIPSTMSRSTSSQRFGFSSDEAILETLNQLKKRSVRDGHGLFRIEGPKAFLAAVHSGWSIKATVYCRKLINAAAVRSAVRDSRDRATPCVTVGPTRYRECSITTRASGIAAIVRQQWTRLGNLKLQPNQWVVVVDSLRSAGNLGTILRTAEAVGTSAVIFCGPDVDPFDPGSVRSSMGALFNIPLIRTSTPQLARWMKVNSVHGVGLSPAGENVWQASLNSQGSLYPTAIIVGEERQGISQQLRTLCRTTVALPQSGQADSLNVAVATGVMLYELLRRTASSASNRRAAINSDATSDTTIR